MGCSCTSNRDAYVDPNQSPQAGSSTSVGNPILDKQNIHSASAQNISSVMPKINDTNSIIESPIDCQVCEDSNARRHILDCSHGLCASCAKSQIEMQIKKRQHGLIEFYCKTCKAPKNLSTFGSL